jgi:hypothetical protein
VCEAVELTSHRKVVTRQHSGPGAAPLAPLAQRRATRDLTWIARQADRGSAIVADQRYKKSARLHADFLTLIAANRLARR